MLPGQIDGFSRRGWLYLVNFLGKMPCVHRTDTLVFILLQPETSEIDVFADFSRDFLAATFFLRRGRHCAWSDDCLSEAFHLFQLRAALQQEQIDAGGFEFANAIRDLLGRSD